MRGVDLVFHARGRRFQPQAGRPDAAGHAPGTNACVLIAAREAGVRRVVYASCASVYSDPCSGQPLSESDPTFPVSPYGFAKCLGEQHCVAFTSTYGLDLVRLLLQRVRTPPITLSPCAPVRDILQAMLAGQPPVIEERTGHVPQDMIYVGDAVYATLLAADLPRRADRCSTSPAAAPWPSAATWWM